MVIRDGTFSTTFHILELLSLFPFEIHYILEISQSKSYRKKWIPPAILKNLSPKSARFNPKSTDPMLFFPINIQPDLGFFMPVNSDIAFR